MGQRFREWTEVGVGGGRVDTRRDKGGVGKEGLR